MPTSFNATDSATLDGPWFSKCVVNDVGDSSTPDRPVDGSSAQMEDFASTASIHGFDNGCDNDGEGNDGGSGAAMEE